MERKARQRGFNAERELAVKLWRKGFAVVRGPASGSKTKRIIYPDLVAMYQGRIFVFEVKMRSKIESIYIEEEKINRLQEFARRAGGQALLAVKIKGIGWKIIPLDKLEKANQYYKVDVATLKSAQTLEEFVRLNTNIALERFTVHNKSETETLS